MTGSRFARMTDEELVENFRKWALAQDGSFLDVNKNNDLERQMRANGAID